MRTLATRLTAAGLSRDDLKLYWAQIVGGAGLVLSLIGQYPQIAAYLHLNVGVLHTVTAVCTGILWLSAKLSTSPLHSANVLQYMSGASK